MKRKGGGGWRWQTGEGREGQEESEWGRFKIMED